MKRLFLAAAAVGLVIPSFAFADLNFEGLSYVNFNAPANFNTTNSNNSMISMQQLNANTVALNVWDFTTNTTSTNIAPNFSRYSSSTTEIQYAINYIHSLGMNVMLKPMLDLNNNQWRGTINPSAANVNTWFTNYQTFIDSMATIAQQNINNGVTLFSVGCELNNMEQYTSNWTTLISSVRNIYAGPLTYSANWSVNNLNNGGYTKINWWNQLDYVGIDAYFPLTNHVDPTEAQLLTAWSGVESNIASWRVSSGLTNLPVLFTEAGYQSMQGANENPAGASSNIPDIQEQANSYQALLQTMAPVPWFKGVMWWAVQPGVPAANNTDFTPIGKAATDAVLDTYYLPQASWSHAVNANWSTGGNWVAGVAPTSQMDVLFNTGSTAGYAATLSAASSARNLTVQGDVATVNLAGNDLTLGGSLTVNFGGRLALAGAGTMNIAQSVNIDATSTLDLANSAMKVNFGSAANDPSGALIELLSKGYNSGSWTGLGITSSTAAGQAGKFALGYADGNVDHGTPAAANQFLIEYTLAGDAFLEGSVGFDDLVIVAQNFGFAGKDWSGGNFNYDPTGSVGFPDLVDVAQNFGFSTTLATDVGEGLQLSPAWQAASAVVPEPGAMGITIAWFGLLARRRRLL